MSLTALGASSRAPAAVVVASEALFLASFILPAGDGRTGWALFRELLYGVLGCWAVILFIPSWYPLLVLPVANLAMLVLPCYALRNPEYAGWIGLALFVSGCPTLLVPDEIFRHPQVGYYAWAGSFFLAAAGCAWFARTVPRAFW